MPVITHDKTIVPTLPITSIMQNSLMAPVITQISQKNIPERSVSGMFFSPKFMLYQDYSFTPINSASCGSESSVSSATLYMYVLLLDVTKP